MVIVAVLTGANAFAVKAADGGHGYKFFYYLGIMMAITGAVLLLAPILIDMVFSSIAL